MKKVFYISVILGIFYLNVFGGNIQIKKFQPYVQPGLSAMYSSVNDTTTGDYLGWPLTCVPLIFTADFLDNVMSTDTLIYNWASDTICSCNYYEEIGGYRGILWTSRERVSVEFYSGSGLEFEMKIDSLIMKSDYSYDLIYEWDIDELKRLYIVPDSERLHIHGGSVEYYSRAIIKNGKIIEYKTLPNVVIDIFRPKFYQRIEMPIKTPSKYVNY